MTCSLSYKIAKKSERKMVPYTISLPLNSKSHDDNNENKNKKGASVELKANTTVYGGNKNKPKNVTGWKLLTSDLP